MQLSAIIFVLFAGVALSESPVLKFGTKGNGVRCLAASECAEPFYCLKTSTVGHTCTKKTCVGEGLCRIGQFCSTASGMCEVSQCSEDGDCDGLLVCSDQGKCSSKGNDGQKCSRDAQCWTGDCKNGKCASAYRRYGRITAWGIVAIVLSSLCFIIASLLAMFCLSKAIREK